MGLGEAYLDVFFSIVRTSLLVAVVLAVLVRLVKRVHVGMLLLGACVAWGLLSYAGLSLFHQDRFVELHQEHNDYVPKSGCLTYDPSFGHLYASSSMSRTEFDDWVVQFPLPLTEFDELYQRFDEQQLGFTEPETALATESAPNGAQTRVYFKGGVMYLSRNVM